MTSGKPDRKTSQLIDDLFPCPEPPPDMAARVLAALARDQQPGESSTDLVQRVVTSITKVVEAEAAPPTPVATARRRWPRQAVPIAAAAALLLLGWSTRRSWWPTAETRAGDRGQLIATAPQTVNIGARAAAAAEPGADLAWSVKGKRARVDQRRGSVFYRVNHGDPFHVVTPAGDVEVTGTCFRVSLAPGASGPAATTLVTVLEGSVKVHTDVGQLALSVGQTARLARGRAPEFAPSASAEQLQGRLARAESRLQQLESRLAETEREAARALPLRHPAALLLPLSSRVRVFGDRSGALKEVSLALADRDGGPGAAVAVQVARDPNFNQPVWSGVVRDGFVTVPAPERGDLYWRQRRADGDGASAANGIAAERADGDGDRPMGHARFLPDQRPSLRTPGSPHNVVSEGRDNTTVYFQSAPPGLRLAFAAVPNARQYRVRIYRASALGDAVFEQVVADNHCEIAPGKLAEGAYVWNALPLDQQGNALGGGRMNKLELAYDNAVDSLALTQLSADATGANVDVAGVAPLGARLTVNGKAVALDDKGRFSINLPQTSRPLIFRVVTRDGGESYWVKSVKTGS